MNTSGEAADQVVRMSLEVGEAALKLSLIHILLGVSRQTISNWENEKSYPDIISVIKMSECYDISLDYLDVYKRQPEGRSGPDHLRREYAAGLCGGRRKDLYDGGGCDGVQTVGAVQ